MFNAPYHKLHDSYYMLHSHHFPNLCCHIARSAQKRIMMQINERQSINLNKSAALLLIGTGNVRDNKVKTYHGVTQNLGCADKQLFVIRMANVKIFTG